jgi:hypothetical protein
MPLNRKTSLGLMFVVVSASMSVCFAQQGQQPIDVSLIRLVASPEKYDGKFVRVAGYFSAGREGDGLFVNKTDYDNALIANGIWVRRPDSKICNAKELDQKYIQITGIFKSDFKEQLGTPDSGILTVFTCRFWSNPSSPVVQKLEDLHKPNVSK